MLEELDAGGMAQAEVGVRLDQLAGDAASQETDGDRSRSAVMRALSSINVASRSAHDDPSRLWRGGWL